MNGLVSAHHESFDLHSETVIGFEFWRPACIIAMEERGFGCCVGRVAIEPPDHAPLPRFRAV
jgi:hypothetical protein